MANYYTGSVNSFADLRTALMNACTDNGWSESSGVLSKGGAFVRLYTASTTTTTEGTGLLAELGTGQSGASVTGTSGGAIPRLGGGSSAAMPDVTFAAQYFIFVHTDPDEVYCLLRFDVVRHYYLSFGNGGIEGGIWAAGTMIRGWQSVSIDISSGAGGSSGSRRTAGIPFWESTVYNGAAASANAIVRSNLDVEWPFGQGSTSVGRITAILAAAPHIAYTPNAWNGDAPLIPITVYQNRAENKRSLVLQLQHARYLRIDNYESGDIITLGADKWMVFPGYVKNASARNGGIDHTGTFGWAVRYIEP